MQLPWPHTRCILCLQHEALTDEHIIPDQIGGKLVARFLCGPCNRRLGHEVDAGVRRDPRIRFVAESQRDKIPVVARQIREGQEHVGRAGDYIVKGRFKHDIFRVDRLKKGDGSFVHPNKALTELHNEGRSADVVEAALEQFNSATLSQPLPSGLALKTLRPALRATLFSDRALLKIAYEYVACHLGGRAYEDCPQLEEIRSGLRSPSTGSDDAFSIEPSTDRDNPLIHGLALMEQAPHTVVAICLFRFFRFDVHLRRITIPPPHFSYIHELDTGEEDCRQIL